MRCLAAKRSLGRRFRALLGFGAAAARRAVCPSGEFLQARFLITAVRKDAI
jgi:hypothetical protein